ncbi:hypothetical protein [uncultured Paraglaciecola sp.]|mgnify:CR=1|uniref:hypothetical protein n=1 Tax=uncultured Paraglaciecola sp. TaxID=1765024 RepID=UPI0030DBA604|tara:strand:- start:247 stop:411 length:165 start_codon:yes stop_codon:yes gene_type:complete
MEISANLVQEIKRGNVVLFLGAGASMGAEDSDGNGMFAYSGKNSQSFRFYPIAS